MALRRDFNQDDNNLLPDIPNPDDTPRLSGVQEEPEPALEQTDSDSVRSSSTAPASSSEPVTFKATTYQTRTDIQERYVDLLRNLEYEERIKLQSSFLHRYAISYLLDRMEDDREAVLRELAQFEFEEAPRSAKYSWNRGLKRFR